MHNKIIHFIWIGIKPKYLNYVLQEYAARNPTCYINLIYYSVLQLEKIFFNKCIQSEQDQHIYNLLNDVIYNNKYYDLIKILLSGQECINYSYTPFIQIFCDILRLEIINIYGGIYIDCDTFPIKPFDDELFNYDKFCVYDKINNILVANNYFMGLNKKYKWYNYFDKTGYKYIQHNNQQFTKTNKNKSFDFLIRRIKFFNCNLRLEDFNNVNIEDQFEHYSEFRWGTGKVQLTKFDNIFNRQKYFEL